VLRVWHLSSWPNAKEHATLSAGAHVDHGVEVGTREKHVNRAADRGCCVSTCCASSIHGSDLRLWVGGLTASSFRVNEPSAA
jgi:hypothetical protein